MTNRHVSTLLSAGVLLLALGSGAASAQQSGAMEIRQGVVEQISETQIQSTHHRGIGAIIGGLGGLGIGSLIGAGTGRDVAMVVGAIGGALTGNEVQKKHDKPLAGQQVIVRMKSGVLVAVTQPADPALKRGQKVYIEGSGEGARVIPQQ